MPVEGRGGGGHHARPRGSASPAAAAANAAYSNKVEDGRAPSAEGRGGDGRVRSLVEVAEGVRLLRMLLRLLLLRLLLVQLLQNHFQDFNRLVSSLFTPVQMADRRETEVGQIFATAFRQSLEGSGNTAGDSNALVKGLPRKWVRNPG